MIIRDRTRLVVLDVDANLFDTRRFQRDAHEVLRQEYGLNLDRFKTEEKEISDEHNGYDLFAHVEKYGFGRASTERMLRDHLSLTGLCRYSERHSGSYMLPGADQVLTALAADPETDAFLLTTGADPYQRFKLNLEPRLKQMRAVIVGYNKAEWILGHLTSDFILNGLKGLAIEELEGTRYREVVVIDDRCVVLDALATTQVRRIHHNRPVFDNKYPQACTTAGVEQIDELKVMW